MPAPVVDKALKDMLRRRRVDVAVTAWQRMLSYLRRLFLRFESERDDDHATWRFTVRVREDDLDGGWVAECVDLPGCFAQGETRDEALHDLADAIASVVSLRVEQQLPNTPPEISDGAEVLRVAVAS